MIPVFVFVFVFLLPLPLLVLLLVIVFFWLFWLSTGLLVRTYSPCRVGSICSILLAIVRRLSLPSYIPVVKDDNFVNVYI